MRDVATQSKNKHGMVQLLNSKMQQQQIEWHRVKVLKLTSQSYSQIEIAINLQVDRSIVSRDMAYLKQKAHENLIIELNLYVLKPSRVVLGIVAIAAVNHKEDSRDIECPDTTQKLLLPQGEGKKIMRLTGSRWF
jgi:hypothetical protein